MSEWLCAMVMHQSASEVCDLEEGYVTKQCDFMRKNHERCTSEACGNLNMCFVHVFQDLSVCTEIKSKKKKKSQKKSNGWVEFMKEHRSAVKEDNPGYTVKQVMSELGNRWQKYKVETAPVLCNENNKGSGSGVEGVLGCASAEKPVGENTTPNGFEEYMTMDIPQHDSVVIEELSRKRGKRTNLE